MATRILEKTAPKGGTNMGVDYVISFRFSTTDKDLAISRFNKLVEKLSSVGLTTEVRVGSQQSLLIFVRATSDEHLDAEVYRSRVNDWVHGVRSAAPDKETKQSLEREPLSEAERLRIVNRLITNPEDEGGAGITAKRGEWENVESIFALHDHAYNKAWVKRWSTKWLLNVQDLDEIRNRLGESIALYFAFTQAYFAFLVVPAIIGATSWMFFGGFSYIYAAVTVLWTTIFVEYWKHQEMDLAIRWEVKGVSSIQTKRKDYAHEKEVVDPITGETVRVFPEWKRLQRQALQIPFALAALVALGSLIATSFAIEIFLTEIYNGPLKSVLVYLPTGIMTTFMPMLTALFTKIATRLTNYENHDTDAAHDEALTRKTFILNFITSYLGILLTAFVYLPFGANIVPYLDVFSVTVKPLIQNSSQIKVATPGHFRINPGRLQKQVIYFTVTAQLVNFAMEIFIPYIKRKGFIKYKQIQAERAMKAGGANFDPASHDNADEAEFLARVRQESELDVYNVSDDLREMVLQFGYLSLFSIVWPLTGLGFLVNDWIELRADAIKICVEMQRPTPERRDTIGPWLDSLGFLSWTGAVTTTALLYLFKGEKGGPSGRPDDLKAWVLLLCLMSSEHVYLLVRWAVRYTIGKLESPGLVKERRDRYLVRKAYLTENLESVKSLSKISTTTSETEHFNRESLEEDARRRSLKSTSSKDNFWARQRTPGETIEIGSRLIKTAAPNETKKSQ